MNTFLKIIRDPIWQAVGVLISVLAIFFTTSVPSPVNGELAIVKTQSINFADYLLPSKLIKLNLQKTSRDMDGAIVDYYTIINKGAKPILPADYTSPLMAELKVGGEIFLVDSCAQSNESLSKKSSESCEKGSFVSSTWLKQEGKWVQERALLNSNEQFCVIVIRKPLSEQSNSIVSWGGRIAGSKISTYASIDEYSKSLEKGITYYLQTNIILVGFGAYWFAALQLATFCATLLLARQANWPNVQLNSPIWSAVVMLLSTSTSEILVDIFINQNTSKLSPVVWPLLIIHSLFIVYLFVRALKIRFFAGIATQP
ncbi:MAG TPA: hypothetical protein VIF37_20255 [Methylobacter sp.]|jgi:hypothetical protein